MKNPIIDNSHKNSNSISDKVKITSNHKQAAQNAKENLENSYASKIDKHKNSKCNKFLENIRSDKLQVSIEKNGIEYHKNSIYNKLLKYYELNKKDEVIESLKKKYASSQELLNWIKIYSDEIFLYCK